MRRLLVAAALVAVSACNGTTSPNIALEPKGPITLPPRGSVIFNVTGLSSTNWNVPNNGSGGTITQSGLYTAGPTGPATDLVTVDDGKGNAASAVINVGPGVSIAGSSFSTRPGGALTFSATGGSSQGYTWSLPTNGSGGAVSNTGAYTAGSTGNTTDIIKVADSLGNSATHAIVIGAGLTISGIPASVAPRQGLTLTAAGGSGTGYSFTLTAAPSGGSVTTAGAYTAGATPSVTDTVKVTDSAGTSATASIAVGAQISLAPATASLTPGSTQAFVASGGGGTYTYTVSVNHSGGSITSAGLYTAGAAGGVSDTVKAEDQFHNVATSTVTVGSPLAITGTAPVPPRAPLTLAASGGSGTGYVFTFVTNASGGTLSAAGAYVAGATGSVTDVIQVADSLGATTSASIAVGPQIALTPPGATVVFGGTQAFSATGGGGTYTFSLLTNLSGGSIGASSGAYQAGSTGSVTDVVKVEDQFHNLATGNVVVGAALGITGGPSGAIPPRTALTLAGAGGSGTGFAFTFQSNASGGTLSGAGAYVAGNTGNVQDVIHLVDSASHSANLTIQVGPGVSLTGLPSGAVSPRQHLTLGATGGSGTGFSFVLVSAGSGGAISGAGAYAAGATGDSVDVVKVTDSLGNVAQATLNVGAQIALLPGDVSVPFGGTQAFSATGGGGTYTFSLSVSASGGTINSTTGAYQAGGVGGVTDVVHVADQFGNTAVANVTVGPALTITGVPAGQIPPKTAFTIGVSGGTAPYTFTLTTTGSSGTLSSTGDYVAGATGNSEDVITVADSASHSVTLHIQVGPGVSISPQTIARKQGKTPIQFSASGGTGGPYTFSILNTGSNPSINAATGAYLTGDSGNSTDNIKVEDALHNSATASVFVATPLVFSGPNPHNVYPTESFTLAVTGGAGTKAFAFTQTGNNSGATLNGAVYTAGATGNVNDVVQATDGSAQSATLNVHVLPALTVSRPSAIAPNDSLDLSAYVSGGKLPYAYSVTLANNHSGGAFSGSVWTAGNTPSVTDTLTITDALGVTVALDLPIGPGVTVTRVGGGAFVIPGDVQQLRGHGGTGVYFWSVTTNNSLTATVDENGLYTAGTKGDVVDVITATDGAGNSGSIDLAVGPGVSLTGLPGAAVPPLSVRTLGATGGSGAGYVFAFAPQGNNSNGYFNGPVYYAGTTGSVTDVVQVTDSLGNVATGSIQVGPGVTLDAPDGKLAPLQAFTLVARGGSGTGFTYALLSGPSGGTVSGSTYTAGSTPSVTDTVKATDSLGNVGTLDLPIGAALAISPSAAEVAFGGSLTFSASGGGGSYTFSFADNQSGGTIDGVTGVYTTGGTPSVTDTVRVEDRYHATATATVTVGASITILGAPKGKVAPQSKVDLTAQGGTGQGYVFTLSTNLSNGSISTDGHYTAGANGNVDDVVELKDSALNVAHATIHVGPGVTIAPKEIALQRGGAGVTFTASGGDGTYSYALMAPENLATLNGETGAYVTPDSYTGDDTVKVTDGLGNTDTATVHVVPVFVLEGGPSFTAFPGQSLTFTQDGGYGSYALAFLSDGNASGAEIHGQTYVAGGTGGVNDYLVATDNSSQSFEFVVHVGPALTVTLPDQAFPGDVIDLANFTGGSDGNYTYALNEASQSGGHFQIDGGSVWVVGPGSSGQVLDTFKISTQYQSTIAQLQVGPRLSIDQDGQTVAPNQTLQLTTHGGTGQIKSWVIQTAGTARVTPLTPSVTASGLYQAGKTGNGTDVIVATDSNGNTALASLHTSVALSVTPVSFTVKPYGTQQLTPSGGLAPYAYGGGGDGSTSAAGLFTAGPGLAGVSETGGFVSVNDSAGVTAQVNFTVSAAVDIQPRTSTVHHGAGAVLTASFGTPPYTFSSSLVSGAGAGIVSGATTAAYTAGASAVGPDLVDTITVTDSNPGHPQSISATVTVYGLTCSADNTGCTGTPKPYCITGGSSPEGQCVECLTNSQCAPLFDCASDNACRSPQNTDWNALFDAMNAARAGGPFLQISGAVVTYLKPTTGSGAGDLAGFYVQDPANTAMKAVFVQVDPATVGGGLAVGDRVAFTPTTAVTLFTPAAGAVKFISAIDTVTAPLQVLSHGHPVSQLTRDLSGTNLVDGTGAALATYDQGLATFKDLLITGAFASAGSGHSAATATSAGVTTSDAKFVFRAPDALLASAGVATGCHVAVTNVPLWGNGTNPSVKTEVAAWQASDLTVVSCPAFAVSAITPAEATGQPETSAVTITFNRPLDTSTLTVQATPGPCTGNVQVSSDGFASCMGFTASYTLFNTKVTLTPYTSYPYLTNWKVKVGANVSAAGGGKLGADQVQATGFTIGGQPAACNSVGGVPTSNGAVVISQVYGGGGNSGAQYKSDFIELHNRGNTSVTIPANTYSVQYGSAAGTTWTSAGPLPAATIAPGGFYLVQVGAVGGIGAALPTADFVGNVGINISATAGKVAFASQTANLTGACPTTNVIDMVGFGGTANCFEGAVAPAPSNTTAALRVGSCTDSNNNSTDFTGSTAPNPRNSATVNNSICACGVDVCNNEKDATNVSGSEVDFCALTSVDNAPGFDFSVGTGVTTPLIHGTMADLSLSGPGANTKVQLGYGPLTADPENQSGWIWSGTAASFDSGTLNVTGSFAAPAPGQYHVAYRFSLDNGASWTYCDKNGAGSNTASTQFDVTQLPVMTVQ